MKTGVSQVNICKSYSKCIYKTNLTASIQIVNVCFISIVIGTVIYNLKFLIKCDGKCFMVSLCVYLFI